MSPALDQGGRRKPVRTRRTRSTLAPLEEQPKGGIFRRGKNPETDKPRALRPGDRGWYGIGRGTASAVDPAPEWRGTTVQVCGMWPFSMGSGTPIVGTPLGLHQVTGATVAADPISWFQAGHIRNPSAFVLGLPGLGKSTIVRRMALGSEGFGNLPLVLGDLKPDYVELMRAIGGQVITLGRGRGHLNVLDPGDASQAVQRLREAGFEKEAGEVLAEVHGRRLEMVSALLTILRGQPPQDVEVSVVDRALRVLDDEFDGVPVLSDLLAVIQSGHDDIRAVTVDRGDINEYRSTTRPLEQSLISLTQGGRLGEIFSRQTDVPMRMDKPVVYDVSSIGESEEDLAAAVLLACWSQGFATVNIANVLADVGLEPRRHYLVIMDELWRALRAGRGIVDRIDALTRLNRTTGVGQVMITHTMNDLLSLNDQDDRMKAIGFVERSGMVVVGGLSRREMGPLGEVAKMSQAEEQMILSWQNPPGWDRDAEPPGRGRFLLKVGGHPGIPVKVELLEEERRINDTNTRWHPIEEFPEPDEARNAVGYNDEVAPAELVDEEGVA